MSSNAKVYNFHLPKSKLVIFHEILTACGGKYIGQPKESNNEYIVSFEHNSTVNAAEHDKLWEKSKTATPQEWKTLIKHTKESFQRAS